MADETPTPLAPLDFEKAKRRPHAWSAESWLDRDTLTAQALAYGARCAAAERAKYESAMRVVSRTTTSRVEERLRAKYAPLVKAVREFQEWERAPLFPFGSAAARADTRRGDAIRERLLGFDLSAFPDAEG